MKTLIIHLGLHKTGSSALQYFFCKNSISFADASILYPRTGRSNIPSIRFGHHVLAWALMNRQNATMSVFDDLNTELDQDRSKTVLLSTEEFDRLSPEHITQLGEILAVRFDKIKVIAYVRKQSDILQGTYGTDIVHNQVKDGIHDYMNWINIQLDYAALIKTWQGIGANAEIMLRPYNGQTKKGESLLVDFIDTADLPPAAITYSDSSRRNVSLPWHGALTIQNMWRLGFPKELIFETIETLKSLSNSAPGGYEFLSPNEVLDFDAQFKESNRAVAAKFPDLEFLLKTSDLPTQDAWNEKHNKKWAAVLHTLASVNKALQNRD